VPICDGNVPRELELANECVTEKRLRRSYVTRRFPLRIMDSQETTFDRGVAKHDLRPVDVATIDGDASDRLKLAQPSFDLQSLIAILPDTLHPVGGDGLCGGYKRQGQHTSGDSASEKRASPTAYCHSDLPRSSRDDSEKTWLNEAKAKTARRAKLGSVQNWGQSRIGPWQNCA